MRKIILLFVLLLMTGCASGVKYIDYQSKIPTLNQDTGRIYFYRTTVIFGGALRPDVMLNNEKVGEVIPLGFFYVDRKPGKYQVHTTTEWKRTLTFSLDKGQIKYVRFAVSLGFIVGHVYGVLVDPVVGEKEIQQCRYTGELNND